MKQNSFIQILKKTSNHLLFFLSIWALLSIYYGDTLYIAQQNSFFSTQSPLMDFITSHRPYGYLWWLGRAMLQLFYYPLLGGAVTAMMLTVIAALIGYVFRLNGKLSILQFLPSVIWLIHLLYNGFDNYYQTETGKILGIPLCILIILILQSIFIRTFSKKKIIMAFTCPSRSTKRVLLESAFLILVPVLLIIGNEQFRPYVRPTTHMQRALQSEDWEEMKKTAKECGVSARTIAAYYAIALIQTGEITQSLFDIEYNYSDLHLHDRNGDADYGSAYYEADGNLHAGLVNSAYRNAMERLTMDGPSALILKILAEASLLNGEKDLCNKYIKILKSMPFEQGFANRIDELNRNHKLVAQNIRYQRIMELYPSNDDFETLYREPLFLGYNIALLQGRSMNALQASLAACLYSKMIPSFLIRTEPLVNSPLPKNVHDALLMESFKNPNVSHYFQFDEISKQKYNLFMNLSATYYGKREEGAKGLKEQFLGFYPYYYYYGNLNAEKKTEKATENKKESNVN